MADAVPPRRVLFLCTGNYYRSRFAEEVFNHLAAARGLAWRAESRGLATELGVNNVGPISPHALKGLDEHRVPRPESPRHPQQARDGDFVSADIVVAVNAREHRPMVEARFSTHATRVRYWSVDDVDLLPSQHALPRLAEHIRQLVDELGD